MAVSRTKDKVSKAYYWTHRVDGKLIKRTNKEWKTKKLAQADYDAFLKTLDEDGYQFKITFDELIDMYIEYCRSGKDKPSTVYKKQNTIDVHLRPFWKSFITNKIRVQDLDNFQSALLKATFKRGKNHEPEQYSNGTLEKVQYLLKDIFNFAVARDYMRKNIFDLTNIVYHRNDKDSKEIPLLTKENFEKFINVLPDEKYVALFTLSYWIGCRPGEVLAINIDDYDFKSKTIRVHHNWDNINKVIGTTKTDEKREVYVPKQARRALEPYIYRLLRTEGVKPTMPLFQPSGRLGKSTIRNTIKRYREKAGVNHFVPMSFRHSNVSLLAEKGLKDYEIAARTGHSVQTLNKYYKHIFEEKQQEINSTIDKI